jgi:hypothetical protein
MIHALTRFQLRPLPPDFISMSTGALTMPPSPEKSLLSFPSFSQTFNPSFLSLSFHPRASPPQISSRHFLRALLLVRSWSRLLSCSKMSQPSCSLPSLCFPLPFFWLLTDLSLSVLFVFFPLDVLLVSFLACPLILCTCSSSFLFFCTERSDLVFASRVSLKFGCCWVLWLSLSLFL